MRSIVGFTGEQKLLLSSLSQSIGLGIAVSMAFIFSFPVD